MLFKIIEITTKFPALCPKIKVACPFGHNLQFRNVQYLNRATGLKTHPEKVMGSQV